MIPPDVAVPVDPGVVEQPSTSRLDYALQQLKNNPYFNAGAGLAGMGMAMSLLRRFAVISNAVFRRKCMISLQVTSEDASYPWLLDFINRHSASRTRNLSVNTVVRQAESGKTAMAVSYLPGHGQHFFLHDWRWIKVERQREKQVVSDGHKRSALETVTLTTLGTDPRFLQRMLEEATQEAVSKVETGLVIYHAVGHEWRRMGPARRKRDVHSVVLEGCVAEELCADFDEFINSAQWYADRGVPYRRGYLFYGPPGTGKSSFISGLASHFGYSICMVSLSERTLDDDRLNHLLNTAPPNSVVILEDIDAAFVTREDPMASHPAYQGMTRVTFSGLLNAIDGVGCAEERILFMTTNHVDRLDPALIRPGRVDRRQYFGAASGDMMRKMFSRFYGDAHSSEAGEFVEAAAMLGRPLSPAAIQGHFLQYKKDPRATIDRVDDMVQELKK